MRVSQMPASVFVDFFDTNDRRLLVAPNGDLWIADARTGYVTEFIPDCEIPNGSGIEVRRGDFYPPLP